MKPSRHWLNIKILVYLVRFYSFTLLPFMFFFKFDFCNWFHFQNLLSSLISLSTFHFNHLKLVLIVSFQFDRFSNYETCSIFGLNVLFFIFGLHNFEFSFSMHFIKQFVHSRVSLRHFFKQFSYSHFHVVFLHSNFQNMFPYIIHDIIFIHWSFLITLD